MYWPIRCLACHPVFVVQVDVGQTMNHGAWKGAATRICPHQIRLRAHQVETKVPGPPGECAEAGHPADPLRRLGTPSAIADVVAPLASLDARWLTEQITTAAGSLT
jgi:NAD(P)-dependent dehydrogenase (short-subunit alcohol dehydrogenase family)